MAKIVRLIHLLHHVWMQNTTAEGGGESPGGGGETIAFIFSSAVNSMYLGAI